MLNGWMPSGSMTEMPARIPTCCGSWRGAQRPSGPEVLSPKAGIEAREVSNQILMTYPGAMEDKSLLEQARKVAGISQSELARRAGTSRTAISAYENGRKSPSLDTLSRLLNALGFQVTVSPRLVFHEVMGAHGQRYQVPDRLPQLPPGRALADVALPLAINWSQPERVFRMRERDDRARVYEMVLREGAGTDIERYVDGALLIDLWPDLILSAELRAAWEAVLTRECDGDRAGVHEAA